MACYDDDDGGDYIIISSMKLHLYELSATPYNTNLFLGESQGTFQVPKGDKLRPLLLVLRTC